MVRRMCPVNYVYYELKSVFRWVAGWRWWFHWWWIPTESSHNVFKSFCFFVVSSKTQGYIRTWKKVCKRFVTLLKHFLLEKSEQLFKVKSCIFHFFCCTETYQRTRSFFTFCLLTYNCYWFRTFHTSVPNATTGNLFSFHQEDIISHNTVKNLVSLSLSLSLS